MDKRKLCPFCLTRPVAINYYRDGVAHYRSKCSQCDRKKIKRIMPPGWVRSGYKKKDRCERCNFRFKLVEQSHVVHVDGNASNNDWVNLKTICANCAIEVQLSNLPWKPDSPGGLVPDY